jgi:hypothetical protein
MSAVENIFGVWRFEFGVWSHCDAVRAILGFGFGVLVGESAIRNPRPEIQMMSGDSRAVFLSYASRFARGFDFGVWGLGLQNPQSAIRDPQSK